MNKVTTLRGCSSVVERSPPNQKVPGLSPARGIMLVGYGCTTHVVVPRRSDGTLNRGLVCVRMHLRSCADPKEPGWPSESLGVQKQADTQHACDFCKQKLAEVGTAGPLWRKTAAVRKPLILRDDPGSVQPRYSTNKQITYRPTFELIPFSPEDVSCSRLDVTILQLVLLRNATNNTNFHSRRNTQKQQSHKSELRTSC